MTIDFYRGAKMARYYAGIGSRKAPRVVLERMRMDAYFLAMVYFTLRSGHADGSDKAFESGCDRNLGNKEIYLPWKGFNGSDSPLYRPTPDAFALAERFHPHYAMLSDAAKKLMARNGHQVLGLDLNTPAEFVVCWTPDGCSTRASRTEETGGTGQAIAIADAWGIPVYNLGSADDARKWREFLESLVGAPVPDVDLEM
jgi:hypothetical protein